MAAGTVTVMGCIVPDSGNSTGDYCLLWGVVQLDGTNPTPVDLSAYVQSIEFGLANIVGVATPGDDPTLVIVDSGYEAGSATLNIEAYKTNGSDPTLVDSTDNSDSIAWFAIGPKK